MKLYQLAVNYHVFRTSHCLGLRGRGGQEDVQIVVKFTERISDFFEVTQTHALFRASIEICASLWEMGHSVMGDSQIPHTGPKMI